MKIKIIAIGGLKEQYWREAEKEYVKRLSSYAKIDILEVSDVPAPAKASSEEEKAIKEKEAQKVFPHLNDDDYVVLLDLGKNEISSEELASSMEKWFVCGRSKITFVIGGSLGLSDSLRKRGNAFLTLSRLTFTHQMTRVILLEQIYRSFKIIRGEPYHK